MPLRFGGRWLSFQGPDPSRNETGSHPATTEELITPAGNPDSARRRHIKLQGAISTRHVAVWRPDLVHHAAPAVAPKSVCGS